jgi:hypothetical protein
MSYYILPKNNNIFDINPKDTYNNEDNIFISYSVFNYYNKIMNEINNIIHDETNISVKNSIELIKLVNPYEFIFTKVPDSKFCVSKLNNKTYLFYDLLEIISNLEIFENFKNENIQSLIITNNYNDIISCLEMIRENFIDENNYFTEINDINLSLIDNKKFNFLFFETKNSHLKEYIISFIESVMIILKVQKNGGNSIIKINTIFHKQIVDILYFLSSLFEKVYIFKPNTSNVTTFEKYIICKNFKINDNKLKNYKINYLRIFVFLKKLQNKSIKTFLNIDIPYYFINKLNDINNIISQQQFESLDLIINILKNKNKDYKIETIQKSNIQKSVLWCEKYKIPYNKFFEKTNIFLPISKKNNNEENEEYEEYKEYEENEEKEENTREEYEENTREEYEENTREEYEENTREENEENTREEYEENTREENEENTREEYEENTREEYEENTREENEENTREENEENTREEKI